MVIAPHPVPHVADAQSTANKAHEHLTLCPWQRPPMSRSEPSIQLTESLLQAGWMRHSNCQWMAAAAVSGRVGERLGGCRRTGRRMVLPVHCRAFVSGSFLSRRIGVFDPLPTSGDSIAGALRRHPGARMASIPRCNEPFAAKRAAIQAVDREY